MSLRGTVLCTAMVCALLLGCLGLINNWTDSQMPRETIAERVEREGREVDERRAEAIRRGDLVADAAPAPTTRPRRRSSRRSTPPPPPDTEYGGGLKASVFATFWHERGPDTYPKPIHTSPWPFSHSAETSIRQGHLGFWLDELGSADRQRQHNACAVISVACGGPSHNAAPLEEVLREDLNLDFLDRCGKTSVAGKARNAGGWCKLAPRDLQHLLVEVYATAPDIPDVQKRCMDLMIPMECLDVGVVLDAMSCEKLADTAIFVIHKARERDGVTMPRERYAAALAKALADNDKIALYGVIELARGRDWPWVPQVLLKHLDSDSVRVRDHIGSVLSGYDSPELAVPLNKWAYEAFTADRLGTGEARIDGDRPSHPYAPIWPRSSGRRHWRSETSFGSRLPTRYWDVPKSVQSAMARNPRLLQAALNHTDESYRMYAAVIACSGDKILRPAVPLIRERLEAGDRAVAQAIIGHWRRDLTGVESVFIDLMDHGSNLDWTPNYPTDYRVYTCGSKDVAQYLLGRSDKADRAARRWCKENRVMIVKWKLGW